MFLDDCLPVSVTSSSTTISLLRQTSYHFSEISVRVMKSDDSQFLITSAELEI